MAKTVNYDAVFPVFNIENSSDGGAIAVLKDGRIVICYRLEGVETESITDGEYDALSSAFYRASRTLPVGTVIQKLDAYYTKRHRIPKGLMDKVNAPFTQRQHAHLQDKPVLHHASYLCLSFGNERQPRTNAANTIWARLGLPMLKNPFDGIDALAERAERAAEEFIQSISLGQIRLSRLNEEDLENLYLQYFNLEFNRQPSTLNRSIQPDATFVGVGEKKANVLTMTGQPSVIHNTQPSRTGVEAPYVSTLALDLQIPHLLVTSFLIEDTERMISSLEFEQKINRNLDFLMTHENKIKMLELEDYIDGLRTDNKSLMSVNLSLVVWNTDNKLRERMVQQGIAAFRAMGGADVFVETMDTTNLFLALAPGNGYQNYRWLLMSGDNAACYLNCATNYRTANQGELLADRYGNPVLVNLFNTDLNNQNSVVVGPTGSGKSFTMGYFMLQRYEAGHRQIIIDVGGTYLSLMTALGGRYYQYDPQKPIKFNPFSIQMDTEGNYLPDGDKINFLSTLLAIIWKGYKRPVRQAERSVLVRLIPIYYEWYNAQSEPPTAVPSLIGFYDFLYQYLKEKENSEELIRWHKAFDFAEFFTCLEPFVVGHYRDVLDGSENEDISAYSLVCFDMARIKDNELLKSVVTMLVTELSLDVIRRYPKDVKYLYMDEAWSMLSEGMGDFVEMMYRTIRKNNGSMCIITQGVKEIEDSAVGPVIVVNADTKIILNHQDAKQLDRVSAVLGFTRHELEKMRSIRVTKTWREIFIRQGEHGKVYRLEAAPSIYPLLTSKPAEREHLRDLTSTYRGNIVHAVRQYNEDKAEGII
ncbi:TraG family conjugative transposon ATPase [Telluribacter humicola]|uniref:TraG family conjugative transposon ATPase n=1 Tax=Telluribacter humicola TaxID=1720261 RepID=UPI00286E6FC6|nr:TraG family conjugative transposon ATPase [Telluribacter humicola]